MSKLVLLMTAFLMAAGLALAQSVPPLMNYQGHLTNAAGQPLPTGQYTLTFNVYNVPTGGTAVWGPQAIVADVIDGYFNVVLSTDSTGNDSISTAFAAQPRYVSIRVNAAAEILPRQQVLSSPYAIQANRAAAADVVAPAAGPGNIFPSVGNVGIGTTNPEHQLSVSGASRLNGNLDVSGNTSVGGVLTASSLQFNVQKFCRIGSAGNWVSVTIVPASWTTANCISFRNLFGVNIYELGCIFGDGSASLGQQNGGPPTPNCGW
jgi:hypothetical protein